jgi:hypothetical protein
MYYVPDPSITDLYLDKDTWEVSLRESRWFTRGWTLQELIVPTSVEFFSSAHLRFRDKQSLERQIHEITSISVEALRGHPLDNFSVEEPMGWAKNRQTTEEEDSGGRSQSQPGT